MERIKIHGAWLEGNLEGDAVDRDAIVFLPPRWATQNDRRYAVLYALHGYSIDFEPWTHEIHVPQTVDGAFVSAGKEMIVVLPDSKTVHNGSMYSSSVTTGYAAELRQRPRLLGSEILQRARSRSEIVDHHLERARPYPFSGSPDCGSLRGALPSDTLRSDNGSSRV